MPIYEVDELSFEVPDGYTDRSMNVFAPPSGVAKQNPQTIMITREPRTEETVGQQAARLLKELATKVPGTKILGQRDRVVGALPGREARTHGVRSGVPIYQRQFFVGHYGTLLSIIVTSTRAQSAKADAIAEQLLTTFRLRKR
jgi:hypothetical protein